jgi:hypothetical protein
VAADRPRVADRSFAGMEYLGDVHHEKSEEAEHGLAAAAAAESSNAVVLSGRGPLPLIGDDDDLLSVLRQATDDKLAPLVDYILQKGGLTSELETTTAYRQHHPNHTRYADDSAPRRREGGLMRRH